MATLDVRPRFADDRVPDGGSSDAILRGKFHVGDATRRVSLTHRPHVIFGKTRTVVPFPKNVMKVHAWVAPNVRDVLSRCPKSKMTRVDAPVSAAPVVAGVKDVHVSGVAVGQSPYTFSGGHASAVYSHTEVAGRSAGEDYAVIRIGCSRFVQKLLNLSVGSDGSKGNRWVTVSGLSRSMHRAKSPARRLRSLASFDRAQFGGLVHG